MTCTDVGLLTQYPTLTHAYIVVDKKAKRQA